MTKYKYVSTLLLIVLGLAGPAFAKKQVDNGYKKYSIAYTRGQELAFLSFIYNPDKEGASESLTFYKELISTYEQKGFTEVAKPKIITEKSYRGYVLGLISKEKVYEASVGGYRHDDSSLEIDTNSTFIYFVRKSEDDYKEHPIVKIENQSPEMVYKATR